MPDDQYAKFMLRAQTGTGSTTVDAVNAVEALVTLRNLHDSGLV